MKECGLALTILYVMVFFISSSVDAQPFPGMNNGGIGSGFGPGQEDNDHGLPCTIQDISKCYDSLKDPLGINPNNTQLVNFKTQLDPRNGNLTLKCQNLPTVNFESVKNCINSVIFDCYVDFRLQHLLEVNNVSRVEDFYDDYCVHECLKLDIGPMFNNAESCHKATRRPPAFTPTDYELCLYNVTVEQCYHPLRGCKNLYSYIEDIIYYRRLMQEFPENCTAILEAAWRPETTTVTEDLWTTQSGQDQKDDGKDSEPEPKDDDSNKKEDKRNVIVVYPGNNTHNTGLLNGNMLIVGKAAGLSQMGFVLVLASALFPLLLIQIHQGFI